MFEGFKKIYLVISVLSVLITISFALLVLKYKGLETVLYVILGGIAIITSIVAIGLSDKKQKTLKINLDVWKIKDSHIIALENNAQVTLFAFEICNNSNEFIFKIEIE